MIKEIEQTTATVIVEEISITNAQELAAAAAAKMDEWIPDWYIKIDLKEFRIEDPTRCILGQICKDENGESNFSFGVNEFENRYGRWVGDNGRWVGDNLVAAAAFYTQPNWSPITDKALTEAWANEIKKRLNVG